MKLRRDAAHADPVEEEPNRDAALPRRDQRVAEALPDLVGAEDVALEHDRLARRGRSASIIASKVAGPSRRSATRLPLDTSAAAMRQRPRANDGPGDGASGAARRAAPPTCGKRGAVARFGASARRRRSAHVSRHAYTLRAGLSLVASTSPNGAALELREARTASAARGARASARRDRARSCESRQLAGDEGHAFGELGAARPRSSSSARSRSPCRARRR